MIDRLRQLWFAVKEAMFLRRFSSRADRFGQIYQKRIWQNPESASGFGSTLEATKQLRAGLEKLIADQNVRSMLDAPCGDFNWQGSLTFDGQYIGTDIVPELVAANQAEHGAPNRQFIVADLVAEDLPEAELVLCRECLNHLPLADGANAVVRLERAAGRFLCITHYPDCPVNADQPASFRYRSLNLTLQPFGLRQPDFSIDESANEPGKQIAIWDLESGPAKPIAG